MSYSEDMWLNHTLTA